MKIAIISITENGKNLAKKIFNVLKDDPTVIKVDTFHKNVKPTLDNVFYSYSFVIGIMATGIMIRSICNLFRSKIDDPGVLIIDEKGKHVISLLSGHLGGANDFSIKIANIIGADPVITTATDINNKYGIDSLARKYYLKINDISNIKTINSALLNNEMVELAINSKYGYLWNDINIKNTYYKNTNPSNMITVSINSITVKLKPKKIVVGLGSRKNIDSNVVVNAIKNAFKVLDLPLKRIDSIATGYMKQNEKGILSAAKILGIPIQIIPEESLKNFNNTDINGSKFVFEKFGVSGVSEPSSLIAAGKGSTLIFRKTPYNGVTVAVAASKN
jgi:cobalt-precorrin 5A hydrolase